MIECISSLISLRCGRSSINADTEDNNVTKAALYFFNETNNLIDSDTVLRYIIGNLSNFVFNEFALQISN